MKRREMQRHNGFQMTMRTVVTEPGKFKRTYNTVKPLTPYMERLLAEENNLREEAKGRRPPVKLMEEMMRLLHHNGQLSHMRIAQTLQITKIRTLLVLRKLKAQGKVSLTKDRFRAYRTNRRKQKVWQVVGLD